MNKVTGVIEQQLVSFFVGGLKPHFIKELLMAKPGTLMASFSLAKAYEAHHDELLMEYRTVNRGNTRFAVSIVENKRVSSVVATTPISGRFMSTRSPLPPPLTDVAKGLLPALDTTTKGASGSPLPIRNIVLQNYEIGEILAYAFIAIRSIPQAIDGGVVSHCSWK